MRAAEMRLSNAEKDPITAEVDRTKPQAWRPR